MVLPFSRVLSVPTHSITKSLDFSTPLPVMDAFIAEATAALNHPREQHKSTVPLKPPARSPSPARTPTPFDQMMRVGLSITYVQKRSLMENLQLEVTERARKLRNQYKLQAQSLRAHIEMRINRVPSSLRRSKMGDLDSARTGPSEPVEQKNQMNIIDPHNKDNSKTLPPKQLLEVSCQVKKPSADLRSKKAMDRIDITGSPEISKTLVKPTPVERPNMSTSTQAAERTKPTDSVDQNNIYAWRESKPGKHVAKPVPAERLMAVSNSQKAPEKAKPMVKVDKSDIYGPTENISGRGPTNAKSEGRVAVLSSNAKIAGRAKPMNNVNMTDISESNTRISVQLSAKPAPVAVSNTGIITSGPIKSIKRKSDDELDFADKENQLDHVEPIPNPKKRSKITANGAISKPSDSSMVLSPKSSNSRTLPHSPARHLPQKSYLTHAASPLKPIPSTKVASSARVTATKAFETITNKTIEKPRFTRSKAKVARKATGPTAANPAAKKPRREGIAVNVPPVEIRSISDSSNASNLSTGTTIKNPSRRPATNTAVVAAIAAASASRKKNPVAGARKVGKTACSREGVAPAAERRVLRNRG